MKKSKLYLLSLCSGIGGMELAAQQTGGFEVVAFCERDKYAKEVLSKRFNGVPIYNDVNDISKQRLVADGIHLPDIICAGIPCQPFSVAGKRTGENDDRHLWPIVKDIIADIRPKYFILENVKGLLSISSLDGIKGGVFGQILADLSQIGYCCAWFTYGAADVGAPHKRERVFVLGYYQHNGLPSSAFTRSNAAAV